MEERPSFKQYYRKVLALAYADAKDNLKGAIVTLVCAIAAAGVRAHWGLLEPSQQACIRGPILEFPPTSLQ